MGREVKKIGKCSVKIIAGEVEFLVRKQDLIAMDLDAQTSAYMYEKDDICASGTQAIVSLVQALIITNKVTFFRIMWFKHYAGFQNVLFCAFVFSSFLQMRITDTVNE